MINDRLYNADELCCPQNEVFEWCFGLKKRVIERRDKNLSPLRVNLGKFWEVCDPDIVCGERSTRRLLLPFALWNFSDIVGLRFYFWFCLRFDALGLFQRGCWVAELVAVAFRLGNYSNILWRIWSTSADSMNCHLHYFYVKSLECHQTGLLETNRTLKP
jgi:hypothetical protein